MIRIAARGRKGGLIKVIWHDGQGACLFRKKLERGRFIWPSAADGTVAITPAQLGYLLERSTGGCRKKPGVRVRLDRGNGWKGGSEYDSISL